MGVGEWSGPAGWRPSERRYAFVGPGISGHGFRATADRTLLVDGGGVPAHGLEEGCYVRARGRLGGGARAGGVAWKRASVGKMRLRG